MTICFYITDFSHKKGPCCCEWLYCRPILYKVIGSSCYFGWLYDIIQAQIKTKS